MSLILHSRILKLYFSYLYLGPDLQKALEESVKLFEGPGARPTARKILVVIMDKRSGVDETKLGEISNTLYLRFIDVIPVAIGKEADKRELTLITSDKNSLIEAPKVFKPDELGEAIMWKIFKGMPRHVWVLTQTVTWMLDENSIKFFFSFVQVRIWAIFLGIHSVFRLKQSGIFFVNEPFSQFCPRTLFEGHLALSKNLNNCDV